MIIKHSGEVLRELKLCEELAAAGKEGQPWHFKQFYDAAIHGVELLWPYSFTKIEEFEDQDWYQRVSEDLFMITFDEYITTKDGHSLFLFPHHKLNFIELSPEPLIQNIEYDWFPSKLQVVFKYKECKFEKRQPFAQAIVVPRKEYVIKQMTDKEVGDIKAKEAFLIKNRSKYVIRTIQTEYGIIDNAYEHLSHLNKSNELPSEIKIKNEELPKLKKLWH